MKSFFKKILRAVLRAEAKAVLKKYHPRIVAVIGNTGKTSVKDATYAVFARQFFVRKSEKSFNSGIGVPLTILGCDNALGDPLQWMQNLWRGLSLIVFMHKYPEWLILEIGVDRPGDMKGIAQWIHPDILIVTRFGEVPVHVEYFSSPEAVIAEKSTLIASLKKDGLLILNHDDEKVRSLKEKWKGRSQTYGFSEGADILASHDEILYDEDDLERKYPSGILFRVSIGNKSVPMRRYGTLGKGVISSVLASVAAGVSESINLVEISEALYEMPPPSARMRLLRGIKQTYIIDDTYNASPVAMRSALETLKNLKCFGKKIAILGDMLELGKYSKDEHKKIGELAASSCHILFTVGIRARMIADGALDAGMRDENIFQFDESREAGKFLKNSLGEGDSILVKGSQGMRMERAVEEIMAEPEKKEELLARQDDEWSKR